MLCGGGGPELEAPIVCIGGRPVVPLNESLREISAALQNKAALAEVVLENHAELGCLASLPFLLQCFRLRHFQVPS